MGAALSSGGSRLLDTLCAARGAKVLCKSYGASLFVHRLELQQRFYGRDCLRHCVARRKVAGLVPDRIMEISY